MNREHTYHSEYTLDKIAKILGLTRKRVRQLERSALKKLKHPEISNKLRIYMEV